MIFPGHCSTNIHLKNTDLYTRKGVILLDVLVALSLTALFATSLFELSESTQHLYSRAHDTYHLIEVYQRHLGEIRILMPYESQEIIDTEVNANTLVSSTTTIQVRARWYGNDRIQKDVQIFSATNSVQFTEVYVYPYSLPHESAGTPLCSPDFTSQAVIGSYDFYHRKNDDTQELELLIRPILLPISQTMPITDIQVRNGIAYLSTDSSQQSDPDMLVVNIRDPSHPELLSGIHTGPGISGISIVANRVYAAVTSRTAQFQIIRLNSLSSLSIEASYKLPLPYASATPPLGSAVFVSNEYVYLGTDKWDGDEFSIIDVSNPLSPRKVGGFETGSKINAIYVRNGFAYIAASDQEQLRIIDVHDPSHPVLVSSLSPSGWERQEGKSISYNEDVLYVGRTSGGFNITKDHELFRWASSSVQEQQLATYGSVEIPGGVYGMVADRSYVYTISHQTNKEFQIFKHSLASSTMQSFALPTIPQRITCDLDSIYITSASAPVIYQLHLM